uniref:Uncharacterized protein n=1 Tax=Tetraselmis sp. GSL018 TaxID=582737 RepID=A0A061RML0_9CHLO|mmetsp:Transcript_7300/g.17556  ORF Transcript_7300/g.17556 Transcript_7300/m.17556 type:complete len:103 (-) Transcript_7300:134-442(-)
MSYDCYNTQKCNGWKQRCAREEAVREGFWRNQYLRQRALAERGGDDGSSVVSSCTSTNSGSTINTMVLKDKIRNLESRLVEERRRRELLEQQLHGGERQPPE